MRYLTVGALLFVLLVVLRLVLGALARVRRPARDGRWVSSSCGLGLPPVVGAAAGPLATERQRLKPLLDLSAVGVGELEGQEDRLGRDAADAAGARGLDAFGQRAVPAALDEDRAMRLGLLAEQVCPVVVDGLVAHGPDRELPLFGL
ncbi:hypothetical protein [Streptomyces vastus]|uniref:hypothetical protein n=1 Tax=Streptomyces vastus TaxID=285451 RepID=UPI0031DA1A7F